MKVLIYGGSFDPPHLGHRRMLMAAIRELRPTIVYVVPAFHSPLKARSNTPPSHRLRMARALIDGLPPDCRRLARISAFELRRAQGITRRARKTFAYELLRHFRAKHSGAEFWFLIGSDSAADLPRWKRPSELKRSARWIMGSRPSAKIPADTLRSWRIRRLPGLMPDVSSTGLRARLLAGEDVSPVISRRVLAYIRRHGLYGQGIHRDLERSLPPGRRRHTLAVARLARELALEHGLDAEAAALAGLLHDAGRRFDLDGMARYARRHDLSVPRLKAVLRRAPILLHAYIGADLALRRYHVQDEAVLSAVRNHTLGKAGMPPLDRLLYVADISSEDRGFPEAARIRRLAWRNLDAALRAAVLAKKDYVRRTGGWLHPGTEDLLRWSRKLK